MQTDTTNGNMYFLVALSAFFVLSLVVVNPIGNFPLNDDWSYGKACINLLNGHGFLPTHFTSMPLLPQVLWGSFFCLPAGFSYNALRVSTLTLSLIGIIVVYILASTRQPSRWIALLAALLFGFNPLYYSLSNTFMTDVPATVMIVISMLLAMQFMINNKFIYLIFTTLAMTVAVLIRQTSLALPASLMLVLFLKNGIENKQLLHWKNLCKAVLPLFISVTSLYGLQYYLTSSGRMPDLYLGKNSELVDVVLNPFASLNHIIYSIITNILYLGLFLFPISFPILIDQWKVQKTRFRYGVTAFSFLFTLSLLISHFLARPALFPFNGNYITKSGIGPLLLSDVYILHLDNVPQLPTTVWFLATIMSILSASVLCVMMIKIVQETALKMKQRMSTSVEYIDVFLLLFVSIYLIPVSILFSYDRYLIPLVPAMVILFVRFLTFDRFGSKKTVIATFTAILLFVLMIFSIFGTKDYFAWNRARWSALTSLVQNDSIQKERIDGGFEFNGQYFYDSKYKQQPSKSWWWVIDDTYRIAFGSISGYDVVKEYRYSSWLLLRDGKILVLRKAVN